MARQSHHPIMLYDHTYHVGSVKPHTSTRWVSVLLTLCRCTGCWAQRKSYKFSKSAHPLRTQPQSLHLRNQAGTVFQTLAFVAFYLPPSTPSHSLLWPTSINRRAIIWWWDWQAIFYMYKKLSKWRYPTSREAGQSHWESYDGHKARQSSADESHYVWTRCKGNWAFHKRLF